MESNVINLGRAIEVKEFHSYIHKCLVTTDKGYSFCFHTLEGIAAFSKVMGRKITLCEEDGTLKIKTSGMSFAFMKATNPLETILYGNVAQRLNGTINVS